jgi:DNA-binding response OmpR family regulator
LLTGNGTLQTAIEAVRSGAFDYMLKPSLVPRLLARVAAAVDQYRQKQGRAKESEERPHSANTVDVPESVVEEVAAGPPSPSAPDEPSSPAAPSVERYLEVGALRIDTHRHEVWFNEQILRVTPTEYEILARLASTPERVVSYSDIAYHTYGSTMNEDEAHNLLRHHIRNLRRKFNRRYLVGVRGVGYMLDVQSTDDETD